MRIRLATFLLLACTCAAMSSAAALDLTVAQVAGTDGAKVYRIASTGEVKSAPAAVWRILADYEHMADYVPNLKSARVVSRNGDKVIVEQLGAARFLFFSHDIRLVVQVQEQAPDKFDVSLVEGDMKVYRCSWELVPLPGGGTRLLYSAAIAPKFYVPAMLESRLIRNDIATMMAAVLARLDRDNVPADVPSDVPPMTRAR